MKRFLKVFVLLVLSLFFIASGLDAALDHYSRLPSQTSFSMCDEKGTTLCEYSGDLSGFKAFAKPVTPIFLHRT